jgi:hypothetical protein
LIVDNIDATTESTIKYVYHETFSANHTLIAQNINLKNCDTIRRLISAGVLEQHGKAHKAILLKSTDFEMGKELVAYLISENNLDKYNKFLDIWSEMLKKKENRRDGRKNQAEELRDEIHEKLKDGCIDPSSFEDY